MPREEFTVRINRKGEIFIECEGMTPRRIKDLAEFMEETIGPARLIEIDEGTGNPTKVQIQDFPAGQTEETEGTEEENRPRLRRNDE